MRRASELVAQALEDARRVKAEAEGRSGSTADAQGKKHCDQATLSEGKEVRKTGTGRSRGRCQTLRDGGQTETDRKVVDQLIAELV